MPRKALRKIRPQQINRKLPTRTHYPPAHPASHNLPGTLVIFTMPRINAASPRTRPDTPRARILRTPHAPAQPPAILALYATHHRSKPRRHPPLCLPLVAPPPQQPHRTYQRNSICPRGGNLPSTKFNLPAAPHSHDTICRRAVLFSTQQTSPLNHSNTVNCAKRCITKYAPGNPAAVCTLSQITPTTCHSRQFFLRVSPPPRRRFPLPRRFFADFSTFPRKIS